MHTKPVFCFSSLRHRHKTAPPPLKQFRARDGQTLSYRFYDSPNKDRVVVLLHGSSAHGEYLHPLAECLRDIGQIYVPNLRGHHASGDVRGDCSYIGQLEDDFADLMGQAKADGKEIYVVGHSSGGGLAIRLSGGSYGHWIRGFVLLSPAIPTAPTMREGTAGGWANVSLWKIVLLSLLNACGIRFLNHLNVIRFNRPPEYCDGTETLSYSFNLNSSYHPRLPVKKDIATLKQRSYVIVGSEDEANDPNQYRHVMQHPDSKSIKILPGVKHLDIVQNPDAATAIIHWIQEKAI